MFNIYIYVKYICYKYIYIAYILFISYILYIYVYICIYTTHTLYITYSISILIIDIYALYMHYKDYIHLAAEKTPPPLPQGGTIWLGGVWVWGSLLIYIYICTYIG